MYVFYLPKKSLDREMNKPPLSLKQETVEKKFKSTITLFSHRVIKATKNGNGYNVKLLMPDNSTLKCYFNTDEVIVNNKELIK